MNHFECRSQTFSAFRENPGEHPGMQKNAGSCLFCENGLSCGGKKIEKKTLIKPLSKTGAESENSGQINERYTLINTSAYCGQLKNANGDMLHRF